MINTLFTGYNSKEGIFLWSVHEHLVKQGIKRSFSQLINIYKTIF